MSTTKDNRTPFRVLALDGGGFRGLYTATKLHTLMRRYLPDSKTPDRDIGRAFDLIVGTSTGAILALALASGVSMRKVISLFAEHGPEIFPAPVPSGKKAFVLWALKHHSKPSGKQDVLRKRLADIFGAETIGSMYEKRKICVCIPAVNAGTNRAWVFKTAHLAGKHRDDGYSLVDVCLSSSAAPIFLPIMSVKNPDTQIDKDIFADGGLWANNPVLVGLVEALELAEGRPIEIVSLGTCPPPSGQVVMDQDLDRGVLAWRAGIKIVESSIDAQASGHNFIAIALARQLTKLNQKCNIIRLPQTPPSMDQVTHLGLDSATVESTRILSQLGKADGEMAHSWSLPGSAEDRAILKDIFQNLHEV